MSLHAFRLIFVASFFLASAHANQTCRTNLEESTPSSRFIYSNDGTVTDTETQIIWMRCAMGQKWESKTCTGKAQEYSWHEARDAIADLNSDTFGEPSLWRLPYVPELASIVERKCFKPRVNLIVFPATPSKTFWTGMEKKGSPDQAYTIDFDQGKVASNKKNHLSPIRLMLDGPNGKWWKIPKPKSVKHP